MQGFVVRTSDIHIEGFSIHTMVRGYRGGGIWVHADNIEIRDCYFHDIPDPAVVSVWTKPWKSNLVVEGNRVYKCQYGFIIYGYDHLIENNEVERLINHAGGDSDYSRFFGERITFRGNHFHGTLASEIGAAHTDGFQTFPHNGWGARHCVIENNVVHSMTQGVMLEGLVGAELPEPGAEVHDIMIRNNVFIGGDIGAAWGVDVKNNVQNVDILHNTFINIMHNASGFKGGSSGMVKNNLYYNGGSNYWAEPDCTIVASNNLLYPSGTGAGPSDITGQEPVFVDASAHNYKLAAGSPGIDAGVSAGVTKDKNGTVRPQGSAVDIGAYEFASSVVPVNPPSVALGAPSVTKTKSGPVTVSVTYTNANNVSLGAGQVVVNKTGSANAAVQVSGSGTASRVITLSNMSGDGTVSVSVAAGTASNAGGPAPAAGPTAAVTVDNTAPVLTLTGSNPATVAVGAAYNDPGASATDSVDGNVSGQVQVSGSVNTQVPGAYVLTYSVSDVAGNTATKQRTVNVADGASPTLSLLGANPLKIEAGSSFNDPGATASDAVDGNLSSQIQVSGSVNAAQPGSYTLTYSVSDSAGNRASVIRTVVVEDTTAPVITLRGDNPMKLANGSTFTDPGATALDSVEGDLSGHIQASGNVNTTTAGSYTRTYAVTDAAGNNASKTRAVVVLDGENNAPAIQVAGSVSAKELSPFTVPVSASDSDGDNLTLSADLSALPSGHGASFVDNGNGAGTLAWSPIRGMAGSYVVKFTATDDGAPVQSATASCTIVVKAKPLPRASFKSSNVTVWENEGSALVQVQLDVAPLSGEAVTITYVVGELAAKATVAQGEGQLVFQAGEQVKDLVLAIEDNQTVDPTREFTVSLVAAVGGVVGTPSLVTVEVLDDDTDVGEDVTCNPDFHSADTNKNYQIEVSELMRVVQLYRYRVYSCQPGTEDGYTPGTAGDDSGCYHDSDYQKSDWRISLGELLRLLELHNARGYEPCAGGEDGFCPIW
jgi:hypothetical protein